MKKTILLILAALFFSAYLASAEVIDKIIVVVNGEIITQGEIDRIVSPIFERYRTVYSGDELFRKLEEARQKVIGQLIEDRLMLSEAKRLNVEVSEREIDAKVAETESRFESRKKFERALMEQKLSIKDLRVKYKEQLLIRRLVDQKVGARILITPVEIANYYNEHKEDFVQPEEIRLRNILIRPKDDVTPEKAAGLAQDIHSRLKAGGDFADLARTYSEGPNAEEGGLMGYVKRGDLMPEIESKVFNLNEGDVSGIIQTNLGYHIFKVDEKKEPKELGLTEVRGEIEEAIFKSKIHEKMKEYIEGLKKNAYIAFK